MIRPTIGDVLGAIGLGLLVYATDLVTTHRRSPAMTSEVPAEPVTHLLRANAELKDAADAVLFHQLCCLGGCSESLPALARLAKLTGFKADPATNEEIEDAFKSGDASHDEFCQRVRTRAALASPPADQVGDDDLTWLGYDCFEGEAESENAWKRRAIAAETELARTRDQKLTKVELCLTHVRSFIAEHFWDGDDIKPEAKAVWDRLHDNADDAAVGDYLAMLRENTALRTRADALAAALREARAELWDVYEGAAGKCLVCGRAAHRSDCLFARIDALLAPDIHVTSEQSAALRGALLRSAEVVDDGDAAQAALKVPRPTPEQVAHLTALNAVENSYDPEAVIGGPQARDTEERS